MDLRPATEKSVTLTVKMFNGVGYITRKRVIAECILENLSRSVITSMEKEHNATAISWWLE